MIGTRLNERYRLDSELDRGGMGIVYRARDLVLDRDVAVKVLSSSALGAQGRARLLREARSAAQLNHPNIVGVHDAGEAEGVPYIVMELVEGSSLHEHRPQNLEETLSIARQICAALDHAHIHGIIHRDLKPENVVITPDGVAKLMDFGLARSIASRITSEGVIVGTVFYLAPEQALGEEVDGRADLYALGAMLYELTTGRLPFNAQDPLSVISQHLHAPVVPPRTFRPDLPPPLESVILKLMSKSAADRYSSAREVDQALAELAEPASVAAPPTVEQVETRPLLEQLGRGRLVGRQADLGQLRELWAHAQQGHAHLVLISGELGVGKTRLAREAMVAARLDGAVILRGGCYEYEPALPYLPFVEALRDWVHTQSADQLRARLGSTASELAKLAPEIQSKLGDLPSHSPLPPNEERLRLFDHIARYVQTLAAERGVLLFIDDLHWVDSGTIALIHYLMRRLRNERVLVLAAYREVELDRAHPLADALVEWNRERLATRIVLGRLSLQETGMMLAELFGMGSVSDEFKDLIYRETEGNPFFVEEVVKALIEQGQIYREGGHWERKEIGELVVPQSVKEAIGRRLSRLSEACLDVLRTAAALGRTFQFAELAATAIAPEDSLLDALDEASTSQLVRAEQGDVFAFTHDKICEVLYDELNPIRRRRLHQRIGEGLERLYGSDLDAHVQDLSYHFVQCGDLHKGLRYSMQAAEKAQRLCAHAEALKYYERAAECAEALDAPDRLAAIHEAVGRVYYDHGPFQSAVEAFQRALTLAPAPEKRAELLTWIGVAYAYVGDERGLEFLHTALQELNPQTQSNELARATAMLGRFHHYRGQGAQAMEYLERARQLAEPLDDAATLTEIYAFLSGAYQWTGQSDESLEWARRTIALGERKNYAHAVAIGYEFLAENSNRMGKWRDGLAFAMRDREIGDRIGSQTRVAWAESSCAHAYHGQGDLAQALAAAQAALTLAERIGDNRLAVLVRAKRAQIKSDLGEDDAAQADAEYALARANESGQRQMHTWAFEALTHLYVARQEWNRVLNLCAEWQVRLGYSPVALRAIAHARLGHAEELARLAQEVAALPHTQESRQHQAERWRILALFRAAQGAVDEAAPLLDQAIAAFQESDSRLDAARALADRGALRRGLGDTQAAKADFTRALAIFEECGAKRDADKARRALESD